MGYILFSGNKDWNYSYSQILTIFPLTCVLKQHHTEITCMWTYNYANADNSKSVYDRGMILGEFIYYKMP